MTARNILLLQGMSHGGCDEHVFAVVCSYRQAVHVKSNIRSGKHLTNSLSSNVAPRPFLRLVNAAHIWSLPQDGFYFVQSSAELSLPLQMALRRHSTRTALSMLAEVVR